MLFLDQAGTDPLYYFSWVGFAILSICIHESSHARIAVHFGDLTPQEFIPLNPKKQMGWFSLGMLCVIGLAWGKVPVNPAAFRERKHLALTYLAGPVSNLILCAVLALLSQTACLWDAPTAQLVFRYGSQMNGVLCVLNLLPVPPLDGFGTVQALVFRSEEVANSLRRFSGIGLLLLIMTPLGSFIFRGGALMADFFAALWIAPFHLFS